MTEEFKKEQSKRIKTQNAMKSKRDNVQELKKILVERGMSGLTQRFLSFLIDVHSFCYVEPVTIDKASV